MKIPNMGMKRTPTTPAERLPLADALFTQSQQRVLGAIFGQPDRSFYANELIGLARGGTGAIQRELGRLEATGLVTASRVGNQKHYRANPQSPIYDELCAIARKTFALAEPLRAALSSLAPGIVAAFVYGSVAKRADSTGSDIDLMVISDSVRYPELYAALEPERARLGRPLNVTLIDTTEVESRRRDKNSFLTRVLEQPKIWIIGSANDFAL